jgi:hypothetical protein
MFLLILMLTVTLAGLAAMVLCQAAPPRDYSVWNDDVERRLLQTYTGSR